MKIALIAGDGVGPEVLAEVRKMLHALVLDLEFEQLAWGTAYWREHGRMMPADALELLRGYDAALLGAVGDPAVPDHVTLWGLVLELRQGLDLWANVRPARLLEGIPCPRGPRPGDVDMLFVRVNTDGEYAGVGGRAARGDVAVDTAVYTERDRADPPGTRSSAPGSGRRR